MKPQKSSIWASPEMEKKIVNIAKKGFKIWLIYIAVSLIVILIVGIAYYLFIFQPILQKSTNIQNQAEKFMEEGQKNLNNPERTKEIIEQQNKILKEESKRQQEEFEKKVNEMQKQF